MPATAQDVEHTVTVCAPADTVYRLLAEVENWPHLFPPTVHVEVLEREGAEERIRIWATANGEAKTWTSRRVLDPAARRITFRQEVSQAPVKRMSGTWIVEELDDGDSLVRLLHDYEAEDAAGLAWLDDAVERNSTAELAALAVNAERATGPGLLSFEDAVDVDGSAEDVYEFLDRADRWAERLPHVAAVTMGEDTPGLQLLAMDTRTADGATHTTESVRVTFAPGRIVYKQIVLPMLMSLHTGRWTVTATEGGVRVTSQHTVAVEEGNVAAVLGTDATLDDARAFLRRALGTNSTTTMRHAKEFAEARAREGR